jgi:hypothetical protein
MIKSAGFGLLASFLVLADGSAQAGYAPQVPSTSPPGVADFKQDNTLAEVAQSYCARGLERFLPGSYYYCVGRRALANGHPAKSVAALEQAARWGSKQAQFLLGVGYLKGDNAPLDRARGLAWLALAAERKDVVYLGVLKSALAQASDAEKARGNALYEAMFSTYADDVAARRAERRFQRERDMLVRNEAFGVEVCIAGLNVFQIEAAWDIGGRENNFCPSRQPVWQVAQRVDVYAAQLFQGWAGHVTVGDLQKLSRQGK